MHQVAELVENVTTSWCSISPRLKLQTSAPSGSCRSRTPGTRSNWAACLYLRRADAGPGRSSDARWLHRPTRCTSKIVTSGCQVCASPVDLVVGEAEERAGDIEQALVDLREVEVAAHLLSVDAELLALDRLEVVAPVGQVDGPARRRRARSSSAAISRRPAASASSVIGRRKPRSRRRCRSSWPRNRSRPARVAQQRGLLVLEVASSRRAPRRCPARRGRRSSRATSRRASASWANIEERQQVRVLGGDRHLSALAGGRGRQRSPRAARRGRSPAPTWYVARHGCCGRTPARGRSAAGPAHATRSRVGSSRSTPARRKSRSASSSIRRAPSSSFSPSTEPSWAYTAASRNRSVREGLHLQLDLPPPARSHQPGVDHGDQRAGGRCVADRDAGVVPDLEDRLVLRVPRP